MQDDDEIRAIIAEDPERLRKAEEAAAASGVTLGEYVEAIHVFCTKIFSRIPLAELRAWMASKKQSPDFDSIDCEFLARYIPEHMMECDDAVKGARDAC